MASPINSAIDRSPMRCSNCSQDVVPFSCGCWEKCSCGWWTIAGTPCRNPAGDAKFHSSWRDYPYLETAHYLGLKAALVKRGYQDEITWAENIQTCSNADDFALEHAFVVCNSGMKAQIARPIFERVKDALLTGHSVAARFGHVGKVQAINHVWSHREAYYGHFRAWVIDEPIDEQLAWYRKLPWIGKITAYHLAKNLGVDCCKPDRHLVRLTAIVSMEPEELCHWLAGKTGDRVATVDTVLWRAANLGLV